MFLSIGVILEQWLGREPYDSGTWWEEAAGREGGWIWSGHSYRRAALSLQRPLYQGLVLQPSSWSQSHLILLRISLVPQAKGLVPHPPEVSLPRPGWGGQG